MASCEICHNTVETGNYVRAKQLKLQGEKKGRPFYVSPPGDEHGFIGLSEPKLRHAETDVMCQGHPIEAVEQFIVQRCQPAQNQPVAVLFNPQRHDFRIAARRQRVRDDLERRYGQAPSPRILAAAIQDKDAAFGIITTRKAGQATDGLRKVIVQDAGALHVVLPALLGDA